MNDTVVVFYYLLSQK